MTAITTVNRALALARRMETARAQRGKSLEKIAAETSLSLRTINRMSLLARGEDADYSPDTTTLDAIEMWINSSPPAEVRAGNIDNIIAIVRASGLGVAATEAVVTAFRSVWNVAVAHRPWYGNDADARLLLACVHQCGPVASKTAAIACGWASGSDRFLRARAALVSLGLINPTEKLLTITHEGRTAADGRADHPPAFDRATIMARWSAQLPAVEANILALAARPNGITIEDAIERHGDPAANLALAELAGMGLVGGYGSRFHAAPILREG